MNKTDIDQAQMDAVEEAIRMFGGNDGIFNTASIQTVMKSHGLIMTGGEVAAWLNKNPRLVQLKGGCHWLLLPDHHERNMLCVRCGKEPRFQKPNGAYAQLCASCGWSAIVNFCQEEAGDKEVASPCTT